MSQRVERSTINGTGFDELDELDGYDELELEIDPPADTRALLAILTASIALFAIVALGIWKLIELAARAL